jgi:hypothetical protein
VDAAVTAYLIDKVLPPEGTVCQPEIDPFPDVPQEPFPDVPQEPSAAGAVLRHTARAALLPEATKRGFRG